MADSVPPCCPSTRNPLLAPNPTAASEKGTKKPLSVGEAYCSGSPAGKKGILVAAGAGGWGSGKTRAVVDELAERLGAYAVMPRMHSPPLEGGEDGDGLPNNFDFEKRFKEVNPWMMGFPWDGVTAPKVEAALSHMKEQGVEKVAGIGFCWGGWCMLRTLNLPNTNMVCAVSFHPACHLEGMFKGDTLGLCRTAKAPFLLMPAGDDLKIKMKGQDLYDKDNGAIVKALKEGQPDSSCIHFPEMLHGWVSNGDLKDPKVARDSALALDEATKFMGRFLGGAKI